MIRFLAFLLLSAPVLAAPPSGSGIDSPVSRWFQLLKQPETGYLCCSISDCRPVAYRTVGNHFQAFIDRKSFGPRAPDDWRDVPPTAVLHRHDNPTGEAVACFYSGVIICFVEAPRV
jgi:hypothetical protein